MYRGIPTSMEARVKEKGRFYFDSDSVALKNNTESVMTVAARGCLTLNVFMILFLSPL